MAFGTTVAQLRSERNLTQEHLAEKIDATNVFICMLEKGQRQPSLKTVILLAHALGIAPHELVKKVCSALSLDSNQ